MKIGNSTATKRGSDISGCGATGKLSGSTSETAAIDQVTLTWEAAYARSFQIQVSANGSSWSTIYSTTTGTGGHTEGDPVANDGRVVFGTGGNATCGGDADSVRPVCKLL
jgi:hypothetical protein